MNRMVISSSAIERQETIVLQMEWQLAGDRGVVKWVTWGMWQGNNATRSAIDVTVSANGCGGKYCESSGTYYYSLRILAIDG